MKGVLGISICNGNIIQLLQHNRPMMLIAVTRRRGIFQPRTRRLTNVLNLSTIVLKMRTRPKLAQVLFTSELRAQLLGLVLLNPERRFYVRELARQLNSSQGTLHRELKALSDAGVLIREKDGNRVYYQADTEVPIYADLSNLLRKTVGLVDVIAESLSDLEESISLACVYGSEAKGEAVAGSDIDLMIVAEVDELALHGALQQAEEKLGRTINYTLLTAKEFKRKMGQKGSFVEQVCSGETLQILGDIHDARRVA